MAPRPLPTAVRVAPAERFRREIEAAVAGGADPGSMTLRMTLVDGNRLRRDRAIPVADLSFQGGVMRYLGVKVEEGGIDASTLDTAS